MFDLLSPNPPALWRPAGARHRRHLHHHRPRRAGTGADPFALLCRLGYQRVDISGLVAGIVVLGFVQGAYATEVLRGAIK
eukprot:gene26968-32475_t